MLLLKIWVGFPSNAMHAMYATQRTWRSWRSWRNDCSYPYVSVRSVVKYGARGNCNFTREFRQTAKNFRQRRLFVLKISILLLSFSKFGVLTPMFALLDENFPTRKIFPDSQKFRGATARCPPPWPRRHWFWPLRDLRLLRTCLLRTFLAFAAYIGGVVRSCVGR